MSTAEGQGGVRHAYREDIDRLRGLAVLSVVAFHFEAPGVHGGYVGVDIFFVISGYLITQIIQREMHEGRFSFAQFYERRLRRLIPALYVVVLASIVPAFYFLLTSERLDFFRSIAAVVTFTSNILFWSQSGYFDRTATEKPLLHTWSLSVEEQFYLVFPLLIWALVRYGGGIKRLEGGMAALLSVGMVASFALGLWLLRNGRPAAAFYLSPARAWEFLIGSIIAIEGLPLLKSKALRTVVCGIAYVLLLVPIFGLRQISVFPGWNALAPCLGAALFIWSGTGAVPATRHRFSPFRLARFFGTISYSMYLWHWPLFTFTRFAKDGLTLSGFDKIALFAVTTALSYLSWAFIEQPFRRRQLLPTRRLAFVGATAASACLVVLSYAGMVAPAAQSEFDRVAARLDSYNSFDQRAAYRGSCFRLADEPIDQSQCLTISPSKPNVLLWGDSHAAHYYPGLAKLAERNDVNLMQATQAGCPPTFRPHPQAKIWCRQFADITSVWLETHKPDIVIMSGDWMGDIFSSRFGTMIENIQATAAKMNAEGIRVAVLGPSVQFRTGLPSMIIRALSRKSDPLPVREMVRQDIFAGDARMKAALPNSDKFTYISVVEAVCPGELCPAVVDDGAPLTWDYGHLTTEGSGYVVERLLTLRSMIRRRGSVGSD